MKSILTYLPAINKEGYIFIAIFLFASLIFFYFSNNLGWLGIILTIFCICFFRDPERVTPPFSDNMILSPADGTVESISVAKPPKELQSYFEDATKVSIFLSVFDIHVNRIPVKGVVKHIHYHAGKFISATSDKSSDLNERQSVLIQTDSNHNVGVVQIAGLIARRIVCNLDENQVVESGARYGIIRFGSRVDIYLPKDYEVSTFVGQKVVGAQTIIAKLK